MHKAELLQRAAETGLSKEKSGEVINAFVDAITDALAENEAVTIVGFGTFSQRHRQATMGKHPQTGEAISIPASNTVGFQRAGKALKEACNQGQ